MHMVNKHGVVGKICRCTAWTEVSVAVRLVPAYRGSLDTLRMSLGEVHEQSRALTRALKHLFATPTGRVSDPSARKVLVRSIPVENCDGNRLHDT